MALVEHFQTTPLAPDVEYFLDAALEHDEIDAATRLVCGLYGPRATLNSIVDGEFALGPGTARHRLAICDGLTRLADEIIADLPHERREAVGLVGLRHARGLVQRTAWFYAVASYEDTIAGGCLEPFKRPGNQQEGMRMIAFDLSPKQTRRLYSQGWMRRYVKLNEDTPRLRRKCTQLIARRWPIDIAAALAASDALIADVDAQRQAFRVTNERLIRAMVAQKPSVERITSTTKRRERSRRRVIARAASTAIAVLGPAAVSDFAQGRPVVLEGTALRLSVERSGSSAQLGHSGVGVTALDKSGNRLASMCVYYENTPALDQLTALSLAMMAGEERDIIQTANLSNVSEIGRAHPIISERLNKAKNQAQPRSNRDAQRQKCEAYWNATRDLWIEITGIAVMGRVWSTIQKALGPLPAGSGHS